MTNKRLKLKPITNILSPKSFKACTLFSYYKKSRAKFLISHKSEITLSIAFNLLLI
jgi:hypothetical protein